LILRRKEGLGSLKIAKSRHGKLWRFVGVRRIDNVVAGFSPRFHNVTVAAPRAKARDYIYE